MFSINADTIDIPHYGVLTMISGPDIVQNQRHSYLYKSGREIGICDIKSTTLACHLVSVNIQVHSVLLLSPISFLQSWPGTIEITCLIALVTQSLWIFPDSIFYTQPCQPLSSCHVSLMILHFNYHSIAIDIHICPWILSIIPTSFTLITIPLLMTFISVLEYYRLSQHPSPYQISLYDFLI